MAFWGVKKLIQSHMGIRREYRDGIYIYIYIYVHRKNRGHEGYIET